MRIVPLSLAGLVLLSAGVARAQYIGPENCKACHPAAYEAWRSSAHARATATLTERQLKDGRCLSCHSPEQSKGQANVTCESCHGGGQYYAPRYVMKDAELARAVGLVDPTPKLCGKCHDANAPSLQPFDFKEKLKLIDHWSIERAARKERQQAASPPAKGKDGKGKGGTP